LHCKPFAAETILEPGNIRAHRALEGI
jgi:hypothetical protein